nr:immunoglobulin light chain junction region [Macaca mulatta]MOW70721.1 immunoglobulin light chain junction region [Macaca mulatta]MOW72012.1 immunoglobulin light chain junction region [Macaca mulatta]
DYYCAIWHSSGHGLF